MATCLLEFMTTYLFDSTSSLLSLAKQSETFPLVLWEDVGGGDDEATPTDHNNNGADDVIDGEKRKEDEGRKI